MIYGASNQDCLPPYFLEKARVCLNLNSPKTLHLTSGKLITLATLLPIIVISHFYLSYATSAWFFQDDFVFINTYSKNLLLFQLFDFSNFGRFLSRNVYWMMGSHLSGNRASYFYLFNLATIILSTGLLYKVFVSMQERSSALIAGLIYFSMPAVITAYAWISNSQHLLGHLFLFLFMYLYLRFEKSKLNYWHVALLLLILISGLLCNIFVGFVLSLPAYYLLVDSKSRGERSNWLLVISGSALFVFFGYNLRQSAVDAYLVQVDLATLMTNVNFYFKNIYGFFAWTMITVSGAIYSLYARRKYYSWLYLASFAFFIPYAFLFHQRYVQYGALTYLFFYLGLWSTLNCWLAEKNQFAVNITGAFLAIILMGYSISPIHFFSEHISGSDQMQIIAQLKHFDITAGKGIQNYCFTFKDATRNNAYIKQLDFPTGWWSLGFSNAFSMFVDPAKKYQLFGADIQCDATFLIDKNRLTQL